MNYNGSQCAEMIVTGKTRQQGKLKGHSGWKSSARNYDTDLQLLMILQIASEEPHLKTNNKKTTIKCELLTSWEIKSRE